MVSFDGRVVVVVFLLLLLLLVRQHVTLLSCAMSR